MGAIARNDRFTFEDPETRAMLMAEVLGRLSRGDTTARICRDPHMPGVMNLAQWMADDPEFELSVARARQLGHDAIAERARETIRGQGESTKDVIRDKAIVELDMRLLSKWDPRRYGDAVQLRHADADGEKLDVAPMVAEVMSLLRGPGTAAEGD